MTEHDELMAIVAAGEAGILDVITAYEYAEGHYMSAVRATSVLPVIVSSSHVTGPVQ